MRSFRSAQDWAVFKTKEDAIQYIVDNKGLMRTQADKYLQKRVPREQDYQTAILNWLRRQKGVFAWKETAGAYSQGGIPDVTAIVNGLYFGFEVKRPFFGEPSELQKQTIKKIKAIGGRAYIVTYVQEVADILLPVLEEEST